MLQTLIFDKKKINFHFFNFELVVSNIKLNTILYNVYTNIILLYTTI